MKLLKTSNRVGHHNVFMGHSNHTQKSFLYKAIHLYNKLPKNIPLRRKQNLFKKWVKKYNMDNTIKLKEQDDNNLIMTH